MRLSPVGPEFPPGTDGLATVDRDDLHPLQAEAIRRMSPERRWQQVVAAIEMARRIREGTLSAAHPDSPERWVWAGASLQILRGVLALADPPLDRDLLLRRLADAGLDAPFRRMFP